MKFFLVLVFVPFIVFNSFNALSLRQDPNNVIVKMTKKYYNKIGPKNIIEFKNMLFRQIDEKAEVWDKNNLAESTKTKLNEHSKQQSKQQSKHSKKSRVRTGSTSLTQADTGGMHMKNDDAFKNMAGDYISTDRKMKFYISKQQECSIFINDTVSYQNLNNANFVEHMILHNNAEAIDPKGVYSDDININFFLFDRKLNIFSVYFDADNNNTVNGNPTSYPASYQTIKPNNFTIEYDYDAINLIKSNFVNEKNNSNSNSNYPQNSDSSTSMTSMGNTYNNYNNNNYDENESDNYNSFIWKILNQNFLKNKENITIEIYFDLDKEFQHEDVEFSLNFTKSLVDTDEKNKNIVKYEWKGTIDPQEVVILQVKFPMYFDHCRNLSINFVMIFVGSVFIIFLIGILYIILSTVFSEDIF